MPLELRPAWCLADQAVSEAIVLGPWVDEGGGLANALDGDAWRPGGSLQLRRVVEMKVDPIDLRRRLGLRAGAVVGIAARWSCRATATAGVHQGGPASINLGSESILTIDVPSTIASAIEIETCLVVNWAISERPSDSCPDGALIWSDSWSVPSRDRTVLLEGSQARIPVRSVDFDQYFGEPSGALWAVDLNASIEPDDLLANVATVLLNKEVLQREFMGSDGEPNAALLPASSLAGMSVDLVRCLTATLRDDLASADEWTDLPDGSVGAMLVLRLTETFGSVSAALTDFEYDQPAFTRELWNRFAPDSWRARG